MTHQEKLSIGRWYLEHCESGWNGGPLAWLERDPASLWTAAYYFIRSHMCPTCGSRAEEAYHTDYDWRPTSEKLYGKHHHFQCRNSHRWCPVSQEKD